MEISDIRINMTMTKIISFFWQRPIATIGYFVTILLLIPVIFGIVSSNRDSAFFIGFFSPFVGVAFIFTTGIAYGEQIFNFWNNLIQKGNEKYGKK